MAESSTVAQNDQATAVQYNNLRKDVLDNTLGHDHEATDGKRLAKNALRWTDQKLLLGAGAGEPTEVDRGSVLTVSETEVFSDTAPTAWTDLVLSGVIGSQASLVLLKITAPGASGYYAVRKNGDTDDFTHADAANAGGCAYAYKQTANRFIVLLVATDNSGIIEWICDSAITTTTVDIIAYIK